MKFEKQIEEHKKRTEHALSMGGEKKLAKRREQGVLNARERIDYIFDDNTFLETGLYATSQLEQDRDKTPADGKIAGFGKVDARQVGIVSNDFTVKGSSSSPVNGRKMEYVKNTARNNGFPVVFLGESTGARMPDIQGARNIIGVTNRADQYMRIRENPWASACLGYSFGSASWYSVMSDFCVIRKGAVMAISSPRLIELASKDKVDMEALGGWKLHTETTGMADYAVDTDEEALDLIKKYLSYMPSHCDEAPPEAPVPEGSDEAIKDILDIIPEETKHVYDIRKILKMIVDKESLFELKSRYAKSMVTAFGRVNGKTVGFLANNPMFKAGGMDAKAINKAINFLVHCDSYNIPIIMMVDQPGFLIGLQAEREGVPGKAINWLNALALVSVPRLAVMMRKSYGLAVRNMGGSGGADEIVAWWTSEVSFMDPRTSVQIVHGIKEEEEPEKYAEYLKEAARDTSAYDLAQVFGAQNVIDPRETRQYITNFLGVYSQKRNKGVGKHLLANWPTTLT